MKRQSWFVLVSVGSLLVGAGGSARAQPADFWRAEGAQAVVATGGAEAADAAIRILQSGGRAADAAVAAMLILAVTDPGNFCFGGEVPIIVYDAKRDVVEVICGQGVAPRLATREYFLQHKGGGIPGGNDPTTAAVPGAPDALLTLLDRYGTKTFAEVAQPVLAILETRADRPSKTWYPQLARTLCRMIEAEQASPHDRSRGLRLAADSFYRGPIARQLDAWSRASGGLLRYVDLATHTTRIEEPVSIQYRGYTILKCGPWTQGPFMLQTLRLLEKFDLAAMGHNSPQYVHLLAEAMKLALADRDTYYADPLFADVPLERLLSARYADLRRPLIDMKRASRELRPGDPRAGKALLGIPPNGYTAPKDPPHDTTTCITADRWGNVVVATPSGWDGVMAGPTGIRLGSRLRSLNTWQGHPNAIQPGKRPRITLTPTLVLKQGKPVAAISVAGGDLQDQVSLQVFLGWLEFGLSPAEAVTRPRFYTDHLIGSFNQTPAQLASLTVEEALGRRTIQALQARGHQVKLDKPPFAHPVMVTIDPASGLKQAAGDPKARRHARGY
ncbi:MAG: gamma-glutamyltransferase family protein [Thermoguttaceae bacterium]